MRNKKILTLIILFSSIVGVSIIGSFIWTISSTKAKETYVEQNNINNEVETKKENLIGDEEKDEILVVVIDVETAEKSTDKPIVVQEEVKQPVSKENTETVKVVQPTFQDVNEKVYASYNVNIRVEPNVSSKSIGTLKKGGEITRTGIGSNGWDRVVYNNEIRYIRHKYLSTKKIEVQEKRTTVSTISGGSGYVTASISSASQYPDGWLENFNNQIIQLQKEFPKGYYWNHMGSNTNGNYVTTTPCNHGKNGNKYSIYY